MQLTGCRSPLEHLLSSLRETKLFLRNARLIRVRFSVSSSSSHPVFGTEPIALMKRRSGLARSGAERLLPACLRRLVMAAMDCHAPSPRLVSRACVLRRFRPPVCRWLGWSALRHSSP
jgi:hypothetical protein